MMKSLKTRLLARLDKSNPNGCWEWLGYTSKYGYGCIGFGSNKKLQAHRASWLVHNGDIPDGLCVCHRCDNRRCINPEHLFLGTYKDNRIDCLQKGRDSKPPRFTCEDHPMAKLTFKQVEEIRRLYEAVPLIGKKKKDGEVYKIYKQFGISKAQFRNIVRNIQWVDDPIFRGNGKVKVEDPTEDQGNDHDDPIYRG